MKFLSAIAVEGTPLREILCYGLFEKSFLDANFNSMAGEKKSGESIYRLAGDDWPSDIVLFSLRIGGADDVVMKIIYSIEHMFLAGPCRAAVCMYDGVFNDYSDIFSASSASSTYAFCLKEGDFVVNLDDRFLSSKMWMEYISAIVV